MDSAQFHALVYHVVRQIPYGKATSYGHVAKLIGMPKHSRHVGQALKFLGPDSDVPWQRVVSSTGKISSRGPLTEAATRQRLALEAEGVEVREMKVSWGEYGWFPESVDLEVEE
ncbi:MGMT family protein [Gautieria morchelliformis]|nr:MGMT family protein [Gautieria morchelliformis]